MKVLVLYFSKTGHTREAAEAVAQGIRAAGSTAQLIQATHFRADQLAEYDALIVASPCWAGSAGMPMLPKPLAGALAKLGAKDLAQKKCGGISVHAAKGGEGTVRRLGEIAMQKGCTDFVPGPVARAGTLLSVHRGPSVKPQDVERYRTYGSEFVGG